MLPAFCDVQIVRCLSWSDIINLAVRRKASARELRMIETNGWGGGGVTAIGPTTLVRTPASLFPEFRTSKGERGLPGRLDRRMTNPGLEFPPDLCQE